MFIPSGKPMTRVVSLDVMRGIVMLLLCAGSCGLYKSIKNLHPGRPMTGLIDQFSHQPWQGLHFWDVVQPAFMFIAGTAMYISYNAKNINDHSWANNLPHVLLRSLKLLIFGVALHCIYAGKIVWELWNVLTQLSFTTLVAYLIIGRSYSYQVIFSVGLLLITEFLYRRIHINGYNQPFVEFHNFGAYVDTLLMGKTDPDGWVAMNAIPTAAHTIWGVLAGKVLMTQGRPGPKIQILLMAGVAALVIGYGLAYADITPMIKRISTSSFVFASGGWVLLALTLVYWLVDVQENLRYAWIFSVMGMNAIFIYLFFETVGVQWLNRVVAIFSGDLLHRFAGVPHGQAAIISAAAAVAVDWGLCYWMYKRNIFLKL
jgi:predicted acyltransferase